MCNNNNNNNNNNNKRKLLESIWVIVSVVTLLNL